MTKPLMLDAYSCMGVGARGYARHFEVICVTNNKAHAAANPFETVVADAVDFIRSFGYQFAFIHTSPPCQRWAANGANTRAGDWPDYIDATRAALRATGRPWVIENVPRAPHRDDLTLCGTMFDLRATDDDGTLLHMKRHRKFETSFPVEPPKKDIIHPRSWQWAGAYGAARRDKHEARHERKGGYVPKNLDVIRSLIDPTGEYDLSDVSEEGLFECIPPAYAEHVGRAALKHLS